MSTHSCIYVHDSRKTTLSVFRYFDGEQKKMVYHERYADLACRSCKKLNEDAAIERGVIAIRTIKTKNELFMTFEDYVVMNDRARRFFEQHAQGLIKYYQIVESPRHYLAIPSVLVTPKENDPAFEFSKTVCSECGRFREVVWGAGLVTLKDKPLVGAFRLEGYSGYRHVWFCGEPVLTALMNEKPAFKDIVRRPDQF